MAGAWITLSSEPCMRAFCPELSTIWPTGQEDRSWSYGCIRILCSMHCLSVSPNLCVTFIFGTSNLTKCSRPHIITSQGPNLPYWNISKGSCQSLCCTSQQQRHFRTQGLPLMDLQINLHGLWHQVQHHQHPFDLIGFVQKCYMVNLRSGRQLFSKAMGHKSLHCGIATSANMRTFLCSQTFTALITAFHYLGLCSPNHRVSFIKIASKSSTIGCWLSEEVE